MHGLNTLSFLNDRHHERMTSNARDPGGRRARAAEAEIEDYADRAFAAGFAAAVVAGTLPPDFGDRDVDARQRSLNFPPNWSITRHGDEYWVLPLTVVARSAADAVIPEGTRRYGMHYILEGEIGEAIAASLSATN
jgi:hypothetical protein